MALTWIVEDDYPSIRAAIDVTLTPVALPDAIIALPIYAGAAELAIKGLAPDWEDADDDQTELLHLASIYWCASMLVPALPRLLRENIGRTSYSYESDLMDISDLIALLRSRASSLVGVATTGTGNVMPTWFTVAHGTRARDFSLVGTIPASTVIAGEG